jgi:hypothetical protein
MVHPFNAASSLYQGVNGVAGAVGEASSQKVEVYGMLSGKDMQIVTRRNL